MELLLPACCENQNTTLWPPWPLFQKLDYDFTVGRSREGDSKASWAGPETSLNTRTWKKYVCVCMCVCSQKNMIYNYFNLLKGSLSLLEIPICKLRPLGRFWMLSHPNWHSTCPSYTFLFPIHVLNLHCKLWKRKASAESNFLGQQLLD